MLLLHGESKIQLWWKIHSWLTLSAGKAPLGGTEVRKSLCSLERSLEWQFSTCV